MMINDIPWCSGNVYKLLNLSDDELDAYEQNIIENQEKLKVEIELHNSHIDSVSNQIITLLKNNKVQTHTKNRLISPIRKVLDLLPRRRYLTPYSKTFLNVYISPSVCVPIDTRFVKINSIKDFIHCVKQHIIQLKENDARNTKQIAEAIIYCNVNKIDISNISLSMIFTVANDHAKNIYAESLYGKSVDCRCECGTWVIGEKRCSCGNIRYNLDIYGDFIDGFYFYPMPY